MEEQRLKQIAAAVASAYPCLRVLVFGSRARGDFHEGSDLNLCLVVKAGREVPDDWLERSREVKRRLELPDVEVDPHVYTDAELQRLKKSEEPYVLRMLAEGRAVYEQQRD